MRYTPSKINRWMLLKLPAAWLTGVRLTLINENRIYPVVDRTFPMKKVKEAHNYIEKSEPLGKVVLMNE